MSDNVIPFPKKEFWTQEKIEQAYERSQGAENVRLPIDQFLELLAKAEKYRG